MQQAAAALRTAQEELTRLEVVTRATGERAAAAEASLAGRADSIALLHGELAKLRERWEAVRFLCCCVGEVVLPACCKVCISQYALRDLDSQLSPRI